MTLQAKYPGTCTRCRQRFEAGSLIDWNRLTSETFHATCPPAPVAVPTEPKVEVTNLRSVASFIGAARERGLKFPSVRFLAPGGGEMRLSVASSASKAPGAINVKIEHEWIGRVNVDGEAVGRQLTSRPEVIEALRIIGEDPVAAAKAYAALTCCCSFCGTGLTDEGSVEVGYGPICAKRYGLPHQPKGSKVVSEARQLEVAVRVEASASAGALNL